MALRCPLLPRQCRIRPIRPWPFGEGASPRRNYYNATPGSAQRDVKCALKVYAALLDLAATHESQTPEAFAASYRDALLQVQGCLGDPGYGPVASLDTELADENRRSFIEGLWPKDSA